MEGAPYCHPVERQLCLLPMAAAGQHPAAEPSQAAHPIPWVGTAAGLAHEQTRHLPKEESGAVVGVGAADCTLAVATALCCVAGEVGGDVAAAAVGAADVEAEVVEAPPAPFLCA